MPSRPSHVRLVHGVPYNQSTKTYQGDKRMGKKKSEAATYNGYCVKCREKRDFEGEVKTADSGRRMAQGPCPVCGTKVNRMLGKND